jgi:hypothetical protein
VTRRIYNSDKHQKLTKFDDAFWDFSFHEMGKYDVKTNIDAILEKTGH